ncbi:serine hydrolase [Sorangium cellulosum]|uniref:Serine hydrolase n=1 Tax=Sorangium cellulosum TaxID=56 RepID=A0A2L0ENV7_SORCE|nr:serine hydrolase domain-containing protein [Sorangium cellulosum]AUX40991.1 serine hydrolase [Sorangium cellulosum]
MKLRSASALVVSTLLLALAPSALIGCAQQQAPAAVAAAPAPAASSPRPAPVDDALQRRLDVVVDAATAEGRIVGTVVVVARDGNVVYRRAAGFADREARKPMREDTVFRLASMTKPIVSATALALVDAGTLKLDDPVAKWLPAFQPKLPDGKAPAITVRHLLTHTAGLNYGFMEPPDGPYHRARVSNGLDQPGLSLAENLERIAQAPLLFEPGSAWNYSMATDVLGGVVEKAGGAPLPEVVRRLVTGPLGIEAGFSVEDAGRLAVPYGDASPAPERMKDVQPVKFGPTEVTYAPARVLDPRSYPSGGAGMVGTADGYVKFLEAVRTGGGKILRPETAAAMTSNQVGNLKVQQPGGTWGFGFGFAVLQQPDQTMPSAAGTWQWAGAYGTHFWVDPNARLTVVVLTNTALAGMQGEYPEAIRRAIYGAAQP